MSANTQPTRRALFQLPANRRDFLKAATAGATLAVTASAQSRPPNVIIIYCDDLGYGDLNCYGGVTSTPSLDQMAADGMRLTHFTSASAVCSPARAALLTGRYQTRYGIPRVIDPGDNVGLPQSETTIARMLKGAGYSTMCVGKWHLGTQPQFMPTSHGFDEYYGIPYSADMNPSILMHNLDIIEQPVNLTTVTQRYTQQAVNFIGSSANKPFFLFMAHSFPHIPINTSLGYVGCSGQGTYGDVIREIDDSVGTVLQSLKDNGIDSNTLVLFSSDHGPWYQGSTGGLRGRKGEIFEGGVRVPLIARWPGAIPAGQVSNTLVSSLDVLPTVAAATGAGIPQNPLDGVSVLPVLTGQQPSVQRDALLYFNDVELQAARIGAWKLHVTRFNTWAFSPDPVGGRVNLPLPNAELYNLGSDPDEGHDRLARNASVAVNIRSRMDALIQTFPPDIVRAWADTLSRKVLPTAAGALPMYNPGG